MPALIALCVLLAIASITLLSARWLEIRGRIAIERERALGAELRRLTQDALTEHGKRIREIERYMNAEDYKEGRR